MIGAVTTIPEHGKSSCKLGRKTKRKLVLAVKLWGSEESIHSWKYLKSHILQTKESVCHDELVVVHVSRSRDRDKGERWDQGGAVIASMQTALQPFIHDVFDLEGDPGPLLVDIANKEQADILVLATRGHNVMKKAMMGSMTDFVMQRASCACLVVKPQIGAGDTYRMKSAVQPQSTSAAPPRAQSPGSSSPMYRSMSLPGITPFNRRVALAYDTTASGRFLLKWAAQTILEPADNIFVVRAVPKMRRPGTSFADKNSVQRLAGDALQGLPHITTFNLPQGNARKSVLNFVAKESVDLLIIGMYKATTRRKGLGLKGNATVLAKRCACPCLVVPMTEAALVASVDDTDLELAAAEEEELASSSESDTDDEEPGSPVAGNSNAAAGILGEKGDTDEEIGAATPPAKDELAGSPETGGGLHSLRTGSAAAIKQIRAPLEALFKRRASGAAALSDASAAVGLDARRLALVAALQGNNSSLQPGRYTVEVDSHGVVKSIRAPGEKHHHLASIQLSEPPMSSVEVSCEPKHAPTQDTCAAAAVPTAAEDQHINAPSLIQVASADDKVVKSNDADLVTAGGNGKICMQHLRQQLVEREAEVQTLKQQLHQLATAEAVDKQ